jgi:hypothetical protein
MGEGYHVLSQVNKEERWLSDAGKATFLFMYKFAYITPQFWEKNKVFQQGTHVVVVYQNNIFNLFTL